MIDIAFGLQEAVRKAVYSDGVKLSALKILHGHQMMNEEEMQNSLFELISIIASQSSFETVCVVLDEDKQDELATTIEMLQGMGNN
jgi:hypothetical protein